MMSSMFTKLQRPRLPGYLGTFLNQQSTWNPEAFHSLRFLHGDSPYYHLLSMVNAIRWTHVRFCMSVPGPTRLERQGTIILRQKNRLPLCLLSHKLDSQPCLPSQFPSLHHPIMLRRMVILMHVA